MQKWRLGGKGRWDAGDTFGHRVVDRGLVGNHGTKQNALRATGGNRRGDDARDKAVKPPTNKGATNVQGGAL